MTWTDARVAKLAELWAQGVSASGIAETLGDVSRSAVLGKLHRLKLLRSRKAASRPRRYQGPVRSSDDPALRLQALAVRAPRAGAAPEPPRSPWREALFAAVRASRPTPWLSREAHHCAFPVGGEGVDLISCAAPCRPKSAYCAEHHAVMFRRAGPVAAPKEPASWEAADDGADLLRAHGRAA